MIARDEERLKRHPERVLQFGEGNFLRCFIDWQIDILNETRGLDAGVVVVRPIDTPFPPPLNEQDGLYTTILRGYDQEGALRDERRVIGCVTREISAYHDFGTLLEVVRDRRVEVIVSNTTEAGITFEESDRLTDEPPSSFPGKLTRVLLERYRAAGGDYSAGFTIIPCELIDYNGEQLKRIVLQYAQLWEIEEPFRLWVEGANTFCSTLVDRIVTGYPREEAKRLEQELGYRDQFMTTGEFFHLFVIQGPKGLSDAFGLSGSGLNIRIVDDLKPYKVQKVGILNGSHTALVPTAFLAGFDTVREAVEDETFARFLHTMLTNEVIPYLGLPVEELTMYAKSVMDRFKNPFIDHRLQSIALNSMTKFKTRLLPQLISYHDATGEPAPMISFALAALIAYYRGRRPTGEGYETKDDERFLSLFRALWGEVGEQKVTPTVARGVVEGVLGLADHWGEDLRARKGVVERVSDDLVAIVSRGTRAVLEEKL